MSNLHPGFLIVDRRLCDTVSFKTLSALSFLCIVEEDGTITIAKDRSGKLQGHPTTEPTLKAISEWLDAILHAA